MHSNTTHIARAYIYVLALFLALVCTGVVATSSFNQHKSIISFNGFSIDTLSHQQKFPTTETDASHIFLLHTRDNITSTEKMGIERSLGVKLTHPVHRNSYIVGISSSVVQRLRAKQGERYLESMGVMWLSVMEPSHKSVVPAQYVVDITGAAKSQQAFTEFKYDKHKAASEDTTFGLLAMVPFPEINLVSLAAKYKQQIKKDLNLSDQEIHVEVPYYPQSAKYAEEIMEIKLTNRQRGQAVVEWLTQRPQVAKVELLTKFATFNNAARWVTQSNWPQQYTVYDQGIHGENQIIGCADTGIDFDHCFFDDNNATVVEGVVNMNHRKIVSYNTWLYGNNFGDVVDGHGTHVTGTIAGDALSSHSDDQVAASAYNGVAYKAKLAFTSIATGESLNVPSDLYTSGFFSQALSVGARIHSNSWGCSSSYPSLCNKYDTTAKSLDKFLWENNDFLVVIAAGNSGPDANTVSSPATSKNGLAVGASQNSNKFSWSNVTYYIDKQDLANQVCVAYQQQCYSCYCESTPEFCCSLGVEDCCSNPSWKYGEHNVENLAYFSSQGPAGSYSNRVKPDVVAPGSKIVSSHSDGNLYSHQCGTESPAEGNSAALLSMEGTSMATPHVAGLAALVRQYFMEGFYPSGARSAKDSFTPTGTLLKAMLISSAVDLLGKYETSAISGVYVDVPPSLSNAQGFGRVQLDTVLYFYNMSKFTLVVHDNVTITNGETQTYSVTVPEGYNLKIALVYNDYPSSYDGNLINDLDVSAQSPDGAQYWGNDVNGGDSNNNVERIAITSATAGIWQYQVTGKTILYDTQKYSLVAVYSLPQERRRGGGGLSSGAIAAIVVCLVLAFVFVIVGVALWRRRARTRYTTF